MVSDLKFLAVKEAIRYGDGSLLKLDGNGKLDGMLFTSMCCLVDEFFRCVSEGYFCCCFGWKSISFYYQTLITVLSRRWFLCWFWSPMFASYFVVYLYD